MNRITMLGKLSEDAKLFMLDTPEGNAPMASFFVCDYGLPNSREDPMIIEVHFAKDVASSIVHELLKGKEVIIDGFLKEKNYVTKSGIERSKKYISANIVQFTGSRPEVLVEENAA